MEKQICLTSLHQILATRFDEGELCTLCLDLGIDYADLPTMGKANKARELVKYLDRRNRIPELVETGKAQRSDIRWDDVFKYAPPEPEPAPPPAGRTIHTGMIVPTMIVLPIIVALVLIMKPGRETKLLPTPTPTSTHALTATAAYTPTPTAAHTPIPTAAHTPIPTAVHTPIPTATHTPTPTTTYSLASTPTPSPCKPIGGATEPSICVAGVSMQINEGAPRPVTYEERLTLRAGDALRLVNLRYCTSHEAPTDSVAGEAYLFKDRVESYENGLFTRSGPRVCKDCGDVGDFEGNWIVEQGQHRVVIALMHYFSDTVMVNDHLTGTYEVDERFYINLEVEP